MRIQRGVCILGLALGAAAAGGAGEARRIPLEVFASRADVAAYPVELGMPFPAGALKDPANVRLLGPDGREIPCQVEAVARHADGSLRAVLLVFLPAVSKDRAVTNTVEFGEGVSRKAAPGNPAAVSEKEGAVTVDTGLLRFRAGKGKALFSAVSAGGKPVLPDGVLSFIREAGQTAVVAGGQTEVTVEERGPVRAAVLVTGRFGEAADAHSCRTRIYAYAGTGLVRVQHTVAGLDGKKAFDLAGWGLRLTAPAKKTVCGLNGGERELAPAKGEDLFQDGIFEYAWGPLSAEERQNRRRNNIALKRGEAPGWRYRMVCSTGKGDPAEARADGWLSAEVAGGVVGLCVLDFWQQFPKEWSVGADGTAVWLHSPKGAAFVGKPGTAKTHEMLFSFAADAGPAVNLSGLNAVFQDWPLARVSPEWVCASGVFGGLLPRSDAFTEPYNALVDSLLVFITQSAEVMAHDSSWYMYGNADFGDISKPLWNWNVPRGQNGAYIVEFLRGGDREWARLGARAARHYGDIDVSHAQTPECDAGRAWSGAGGWMTNRDGMMKRTPRWLNVGKDETAEAKIARAEENFRSVPVPRDVHQQYVLPRNEGGESHTGGAWPHFFLSGDRRALEVLREQGAWFLRQAEARKPRDADGFALAGLLDAFEATGEESFLKGAAVLVKGLVEEWKAPLEQRRGLAELKARAEAGKVDADKVPSHGYWEPFYLGGGRDMEPFVRRPRSVFRFLDIGAPESQTGVNADEARRMLAECMEMSVFWQDGGCTPSYIHPWAEAANLGLWPEKTRDLFERKTLVFVTLGKDTWSERIMKAPDKAPVLKYKTPFLRYGIRGPDGWRKEGNFGPLDMEAIRKGVVTEAGPHSPNSGRFVCSLHELGIEHAMLSYPHFLAAWKPYHEKYLKPRMNAEGVLEFSATPPTQNQGRKEK